MDNYTKFNFIQVTTEEVRDQLLAANFTCFHEEFYDDGRMAFYFVNEPKKFTGMNFDSVDMGAIEFTNQLNF